MKIFFIVYIIFMLVLMLSGCDNSIIINRRKISFSSPKNELKIMTFNIRHANWKAGWGKNNRGTEIINILYKLQADVICLQEAYNFQVDDIKNSLPDYDYYGVGREDGKNKGEFCPIFYRNDRFVLKESGTFWFSNTPDKPGSKILIDIVPRICSWIKLKDNYSGKEVYIYNIHLTPISKNSKRKNVLLLKERIQNPCIIAGDFNMEISDPSMNPLKDFNATFFENKQIDHIFSSKEIKIKDFFLDISKNYPSDHYALIAMTLLDN